MSTHANCSTSTLRPAPGASRGDSPAATEPVSIPHTPSAKQRLFLDLTCLEALYGGAAGGGKSEALLMAALQYVNTPGYAALILRKDTQRLQLAGGLIPRSLDWLADSGAVWNVSRRQWTFSSGATITFGYLSNGLDKYRYGSSEFQFIAFDELTEFAEDDYLFLFSRLRKVQELNVPLRMRSASNPGGIGHVWVKGRFVGQDSGVRNQESGLDRVFIPARIADNPGLSENEYRKSLTHLPAVLRERLMNGDWSVQEEGVFQQSWLRYYDLVGHGTKSEQLEIRHTGRVIATIPTASCRRFCTIDPAGTSADKARESRGRPASHSVIQVWDQPWGEASKYLFLRHSWRGRVGFDGLVKVIREIHRTWRPQRLWIENEKLGEAAVDLLYPELPLETISTLGRDKLTRAAPLILKFEQGEILLPQLNNSWRLDFEAELLSWTGRDDQPSDQIDAAAYAAIIGQQQGGGVIRIPPVGGHMR